MVLFIYIVCIKIASPSSNDNCRRFSAFQLCSDGGITISLNLTPSSLATRAFQTIFFSILVGFQILPDFSFVFLPIRSTFTGKIWRFFVWQVAVLRDPENPSSAVLNETQSSKKLLTLYSRHHLEEFEEFQEVLHVVCVTTDIFPQKWNDYSNIDHFCRIETFLSMNSANLQYWK